MNMGKRKRNMVPVFKALALLAGIAAALLFTAAMANIGMDNMDEWYYDNGEQGMDSGIEQGMPECATEDQTYGPCYWDGTRDGTYPEGKSFTVDALGNVTYWEDYQS